MGLNSIIQANVDKAFKLLGDLVVTVTLSKKTASAFDFNLKAPILSSTALASIEAIKLPRKKSRDDSKLAYTDSFLFKSIEIGDASLYDTITLSDGTVWGVVLPITNDGFITTLNVARSANG